MRAGPGFQTLTKMQTSHVPLHKSFSNHMTISVALFIIMASGREYRRELWFERLFGFRETVPAVYRNFVVEEGEDHVVLVSKANGRRFNAGRFTLQTVDSFASLQPAGGGSLNIIKGDGKISTNALEAQALPEFNGATFLAASNFNCLEFTSSTGCASHGVTNYVHDHTQGPYTALGAGAAVVYRNYFVKHESGKVGQLEEEVNLLKNTPLAKTMSHGYCIINKTNLKSLRSFNWSNLSNFYVGVHENCQVTTKQVGTMFADVTGDQIVHQVYAAAFNFGGSVLCCEETLEIAKWLLKAEYAATIRAAWNNSIKYPGRPGSKKLVLTLLGGGVFKNPKELICEAITSCEQLIIDSGLEVYVVCFTNSIFQQVYPLLKDTVARTNGKII